MSDELKMQLFLAESAFESEKWHRKRLQIENKELLDTIKELRHHIEEGLFYIGSEPSKTIGTLKASLNKTNDIK